MEHGYTVMLDKSTYVNQATIKQPAYVILYISITHLKKEK